MNYALRNPDTGMFVVRVVESGVIWTSNFDDAAKWDSEWTAGQAATYFNSHFYADVSPFIIASVGAIAGEYEIVDLRNGEWSNAMNGMSWATQAEALVYFDTLVKSYGDIRRVPHYRIQRVGE